MSDLKTFKTETLLVTLSSEPETRIVIAKNNEPRDFYFQEIFTFGCPLKEDAKKKKNLILKKKR